MGNNLLRVTGMVSGMDTESIISMYASKTKSKLDKAKKSKIKNTYKQDAWKDLNNKIYSFYSKTLSNNRLSGAYQKQKTTTSNSALSVTAGAGAPTGVQTAQIKSAAAAAYFTGATMTTTGEDGVKRNVKSDESLADALNLSGTTSFKLETANGTQTFSVMSQDAYNALTDADKAAMAENNITAVATMSDLVEGLKAQGVNANYDEANGRLFVSAKETGKKADFNFTADGENWQSSLNTLNKLGLLTNTEADKFAKAVKEQVPEYADSDLASIKQSLGFTNLASKIDGSSAKLVLNGAEFESDSNTFTINGSTYTINHVPTDTNENITVNTQMDYDGVYDVVKNMLKEYNSLVNEMSKLYNADSAKDYEPLLSEEKEALSEKEADEWEKKIKDSILRKDSRVNEIMSALTEVMSSGIEVGGKTVYLSEFGISTQGYFEADKNERYALHIDGDPDDQVTGGNTDKLKSKIAADPEQVMEYFQQLSANLYDKLYEKMTDNSSMSSIYKVYNDKQLASEATDWDKKIADLEDKITAIEDKWYSKFAKMETRLAKLQKNQTAVGGFFS
jgi:flagellar hook-associated protein 2